MRRPTQLSRCYKVFRQMRLDIKADLSPISLIRKLYHLVFKHFLAHKWRLLRTEFPLSATYMHTGGLPLRLILDLDANVL